MENLTEKEMEELAEFEEEIRQGFADNMFCDNYGYCCGTSCKNYHKCQG